MRPRRRTVLATGFLVALMGLAGRSAAQPLSLEEAVSLAMSQSPAARMAAGEVDAAAARTRQAGAAFLPYLKLNSSYTQSDNPVQVFSFALSQGQFALSPDINDPEAADNWLVSGQVGMRLFNGGSDWANRKAAQHAERGARELQSAARDAITLQVARAYLSVLTAAEFVRAAESSVAAYDSSESVVASRVAAGTVLKTELLNIQVQSARAQEKLLAARDGLSLAKESLRLSLGMDSLPYSEFGSLEDIKLVAPGEPAAPERSEVRAQEAFARAARSELRAAQGGYLPSLSAFANLDRYQGWEFDGTKSSWEAGVMLEWSLFDGLFTPAAVGEKRARLKSAEEGARLARLQTSVELTTARLNVRESSERVGVMHRAVELARESAMLTRQRLHSGLAISSQVIDAEDALAQAQVGLAQAKADELYAIATLRRASGVPIIGETQP